MTKSFGKISLAKQYHKELVHALIHHHSKKSGLPRLPNDTTHLDPKKDRLVIALRKIRLARGFSQSTIAAYLGVSKNTIVAIEGLPQENSFNLYSTENKLRILKAYTS
jgi:DNA-binding XRE family transcriptional regulator